MSPKLKTNKGASKRFKKTGTGKILRSRAFGSHILTKKDRKRKRRLRQKALVAGTDRVRVARMIPFA
ncbi:MAG: 50S ribosomal protein L35 [Nitrospinae bacterium]|nr:50S ribosomal protein L35 [Nitrospinota bacterium]